MLRAVAPVRVGTNTAAGVTYSRLASTLHCNEMLGSYLCREVDSPEHLSDRYLKTFGFHCNGNLGKHCY